MIVAPLLLAVAALAEVDADAARPLAGAAPPRLLRIAVTDVSTDGAEPRLAEVAGRALVAELRKLRFVSVVASEEIRAMLELEADKQLLGCGEEESCLAEIAEALGADVLVTGSLAVVGDELFLGLRRMDSRSVEVQGVDRRFDRREGGVVVLAALGPMVAELFPDLPLRPGEERGVAKETLRSLNPPPLHPALFWSGVGVSAAALSSAAGFGALNLVAVGDYHAYVASGAPGDGISLDAAKSRAESASGAAAAAWISLGVAAAAAAGAAVAFPFTDFEGAEAASEGGAP